jgi:hypothetical protein
LISLVWARLEMGLRTMQTKPMILMGYIPTNEWEIMCKDPKMLLPMYGRLALKKPIMSMLKVGDNG